MEYFNQITNEYLVALRRECRYKMRIELLSRDENVIGEITRDISLSNQGQISVNFGNIVRRSCTISLANLKGKYNPSQDAWFWVDRKFKLWLGVHYDGNTYWFSQGIYYTTDVNGDSNIVTINAVDKGGALDGTLKLNMTDTKYIIEKGCSVYDAVRDTLYLNEGSGMIDSVEPLIDDYFRTQYFQADISISENDYIGSLFTQVADQYGANVFYDGNGRLNFVRQADSELLDGYMRMGSQYDFTDKTAHYLQSSYNYAFDYVNAVTVYTNVNALDSNNVPIQNVSYTAYNTNPTSSINVDSIRIRRMENTEIKYINGLETEEMQDRCQQYGEYLLFKSSLSKMAIQFSTTIIPHLDVNKVITIRDAHKNIDMQRFVVQSITFPLYAGEMTINATDMNMLPATKIL